MILPISTLSACLFIINLGYSFYVLWYVKSVAEDNIQSIEYLAERLKKANDMHMKACQEAMDQIDKICMQHSETKASEPTETPTSD